MISELSQEADRRVETHQNDAATVVLLIYGSERSPHAPPERGRLWILYTHLKKPVPRPEGPICQPPGRQGPGVGIHVVTWADTLGTGECTFDRQSWVNSIIASVFQTVLAPDLSSLIDSPIANQLGPPPCFTLQRRARRPGEFPPYAALTDEWLADVARCFTGRGAPEEGKA